ncbi:MAG: hypothetical protein ACKVRN_08545 [Pyrinomonadaceae bacterium]
MSSAKHGHELFDPNKPYEENVIRLKGIIGFAIGLFLLIVVTFGLMWMLLGAMEDNARDNADPVNPMAMKERERLPPEPRLQLAPGFGVESERGWVNMELREPAAEYIELKRQWDEVWKNGQKDKKTGVTSIMPIETAKQKFLASQVKAKSGAEAEKSVKDSRMIVSDSSAGRLASESRR